MAFIFLRQGAATHPRSAKAMDQWAVLTRSYLILKMQGRIPSEWPLDGLVQYAFNLNCTQKAKVRLGDCRVGGTLAIGGVPHSHKWVNKPSILAIHLNAMAIALVSGAVAYLTAAVRCVNSKHCCVGVEAVCCDCFATLCFLSCKAV